MKKVFSVTEAKTQFSKLLRRAAAGEEIIITKWGVPVARLVPAAQKDKRQLGFYEGKLIIPDDFDAPLPSELPDAVEGKSKPRREKTRKQASHYVFIGVLLISLTSQDLLYAACEFTLKFTSFTPNSTAS